MIKPHFSQFEQEFDHTGISDSVPTMGQGPVIKSNKWVKGFENVRDWETGHQGSTSVAVLDIIQGSLS